MKIILKGKPISTQHAYGQRGKIRYMKKVAKDLKKCYAEQAWEQWQSDALSCTLAIKIDIFFGDKRIRDWDNWHKISMDALTGIVWDDDSQIKKATVETHYCKENPRIEIELSIH